MKRKAMVKRERNGRAQRTQHEGQELLSAGEVQRLRAAAVAGMRDAVWGSTLGWLYLSGKINAPQFAAGKRWNELVSEYQIAMRAPRLPSTARLERSASTAIDPDTDEGRREAHRHAQIMDEFDAASAMLAHAGSASVRAVADVCDRDQLPVGADGLAHLASGLQVLMAFWSATGRKRH